ncbi:MAG TPA: hypothetical protein VIH11_06535 [Gemmatimonadaceae bacterium]
MLSAAPKTAVESVAKTVARGEGQFGIPANCVAPGRIDVGLGAGYINAAFTDAYGLLVFMAVLMLRPACSTSTIFATSHPRRSRCGRAFCSSSSR